MNTVTLIRAELKRFADDTLVEVMGRVVAEVYRETDAKIAALEAKLAEFTYKGAWTEGRQYKRGNFVTAGSVWHANADTRSRPGVDSDWSLALPKPRDGRDGMPPPEPPEPRAAGTGKRSGRPSPLVAVRNNSQ